MRRVHAFELEDQTWLPRVVRNGATDLLDLLFGRLGFYAGVAPELVRVLTAARAEGVVDLCSGGGGGILLVRDLLRAEGRRFRIVLTDAFPNASGIERVRALGDPMTTYETRPYNILHAELSGGEAAWRPEGVGAGHLLSMSGALHHFTPEQIHALVASLVRQRASFVFFDPAASPLWRRMPLLLAPVAALLNAVMLFVVALVLTPFVRPVRLSRILLTYVLPLIPAVFAWDGMVSGMRAYSPDELLAICHTVAGSDAYEWRSEVRGAALYLTGLRRQREELEHDIRNRS